LDPAIDGALVAFGCMINYGLASTILKGYEGVNATKPQPHMSNRNTKRRRVRLQMTDKKSHRHGEEVVAELVPRTILTSSPLYGMSEIAQKIVRDNDPDDFQEFTAATKSFQDAWDGDTMALRERLKRGELTLEECQLAADLLSPGKIVRPAHRPIEERGKDKRKLARRVLAEWLWAGEPPILDAAGQQISIEKAVQLKLGPRGLSHGMVNPIERELRRLRPYCIAGLRLEQSDV
jgi:hypothetical protein